MRVKALWDAITEVDQMRLWCFESIPSFKPEVGFETFSQSGYDIAMITFDYF